MNEVVFDTNVLIAIIYDDDPNSREASEVARKAEKIRLPVVSIMETAYFMHKHKTPLAYLTRVLNGKFTIVENDASDLEDAFQSPDLQHMQYDGLADHAILHCAKRKGLKLCTFDDKLQRKAKDNHVEVCYRDRPENPSLLLAESTIRTPKKTNLPLEQRCPPTNPASKHWNSISNRGRHPTALF